MSDFLEKDILIINKLGIHARPAAMLVQLASKFRSDIYIFKDSVEVNCKSIMGIMTLAANCGSRIKIKAEGKDAVQAVEEIEELFKNKFGEE